MSISEVQRSDSRQRQSERGLLPQAVMVHALHKTASMFLFSFFRQLASQANFEFFSPNLPEEQRHPPSSNYRTRYCLCPVRSYATQTESSETDLQRIFHVRDPRDILVSEYYSIAFIHPLETEKLKERRNQALKMTVDEYALKHSDFSEYPLEKKFAPLLQRMQFSKSLDTNRPDIIVKYETMVTRFYRWAIDVTRPFGFPFPRVTAAKLAWQYRREFIPPAPGSDLMEHKRRITPGDFRNKLSRSTIATLNDRFGPILEAFEYAP